MKSLITRCALVAGFVVAVLTFPALASSPTTISDGPLFSSKTAQLKFAANPYDCFTDDGYGRKRPCSAGYKKGKKAKTSNK